MSKSQYDAVNIIEIVVVQAAMPWAAVLGPNPA